MIEQTHHLRPHRAERVITAGRLLLAVFLVLAVALDPPEPARHATALQALSLTYLAYASLVAILTWSRRTTPHQLPLLTHAVDLVLFSIFMFLSEAPTSPFFVYFIFATVCGALRWHGRGALLTGAAALAAYVVVTVAGRAYLSHADEFDQVRFITRCTQLGVITLLLSYLGSYQRRLQSEIARLAAWPRRLPADERAAVENVLSHAAAILRVPRMILLWAEGEEPSLRVAIKDDDRLELSHARPDVFGSLVAEPLERSSFLCDDASAPSPFVVYRVPGGFASIRVRPLSQVFCDRYRVNSALVLRITNDEIDGRLVALDRSSLSVDDLLLGDIVGRLVSSALEQQALIMRLKEAAVGQERLRVARELHDGVLQSLTAVGIQIYRLRALQDLDSTDVRHRLGLLEDTIATEHRALRRMLEDLHPGRNDDRSRVELADRLRELAARLERQWDVDVRCHSAPDMPALSATLVHEISRMAEEAVVNAIRHGGATQVHLAMESQADEKLRLLVSYHGRPFAAFAGRHNLASLRRMQAGPRSLMERIAALDGELVIESHDSGATVEIVVSARQQLVR